MGRMRVKRRKKRKGWWKRGIEEGVRSSMGGPRSERWSGSTEVEREEENEVRNKCVREE